jgi:hypothetical protein
MNNKNLKYIDVFGESCKKNKINYSKINSNKVVETSYIKFSGFKDLQVLSNFKINANSLFNISNKFNLNSLVEIINFNFLLFYKNLNFVLSYFYNYKNNILDINYNNFSKFNIKVST